ncbi:MFS transporter [Nocardiopsis ansamitocini]|uniref:MFS transporter n=1 Tax=Nocardiopsis ansamitocini TaxID=1670832 RepID=A0A9W6P9A1_9ACTN|nr:MFS transporter [Nocardiopsis ansamitocini]GLU49975.1 MFS transporter [Nocardiopsis ansamitocini]
MPTGSASSPQHRPGTGPPRLSGAFHRFLAGSLSSNLADGVMMTALPMLAAALTGDPLAVAGLTAARYLPWLLFGLLAGVLVDRVDRVRAMIVANLLRSAAIIALAVITATGNGTIVLLYVVMFTAMSCEIVYDIAARAVLPSLARGAVDRANARLVGGREVVQEFLGAPLAGFLFVVAAALPLAVNAGAYVLGAFILLGLPLSARRPSPPSEVPARDRAGSAPGAIRSVFCDIGAGLRYVYGDPPLRGLVVFTSVVNLSAGALSAVFVLIVQNHFGVPENLFGVFLAVAAVGAIGGAALAERLTVRIGRFGTLVGGFLAQAAMCLVFAFAPNALVAALAWALIAGAGTVAAIVSMGIVQQIVPEHLMGRVVSAKQMLGLSFVPVGALVGGLLGRVDLRLPPLLGVLVFTVATLLALRCFRVVAARADAAEAAARRDVSGALD